jgi:hypothetical protein
MYGYESSATMTTDRFTTNCRNVLSSERVEYFHRNPCEATEKDPSSLRWGSNVWLWVLRDSDHWQIALQITGPSSRQRGRPKTKSKAIVRQKKMKRIWSWAPKGCLTPGRIGRLTFGHNINSTQVASPFFTSSLWTGQQVPAALPPGTQRKAK